MSMLMKKGQSFPDGPLRKAKMAPLSMKAAALGCLAFDLQVACGARLGDEDRGSNSLSAEASTSLTSCAGWSPNHGEWQNTGATCAKWGWVMDWCYVDERYVGPGKDFMTPSVAYDGKWVAPCVPSTSATVAAKAVAHGPSLLQSDSVEEPATQSGQGSLADVHKDVKNTEADSSSSKQGEQAQQQQEPIAACDDLQKILAKQEQKLANAKGGLDSAKDKAAFEEAKEQEEAAKRALKRQQEAELRRARNAEAKAKEQAAEAAKASAEAVQAEADKKAEAEKAAVKADKARAEQDSKQKQDDANAKAELAREIVEAEQAERVAKEQEKAAKKDSEAAAKAAKAVMDTSVAQEQKISKLEKDKVNTWSQRSEKEKALEKALELAHEAELAQQEAQAELDALKALGVPSISPTGNGTDATTAMGATSTAQPASTTAAVTTSGSGSSTTAVATANGSGSSTTAAATASGSADISGATTTADPAATTSQEVSSGGTSTTKKPAWKPWGSSLQEQSSIQASGSEDAMKLRAKLLELELTAAEAS